MEAQEFFNSMMENAIVYLQEKGYLPKQTAQQQQQNGIDWDNPEDIKKVNKGLQEAGLLPNK